MTARTLSLPGGRQLVLDSVGTSVDYTIRRPFVGLVPAFDAGEQQRVEAIAVSLIALGCVELCCVGPRAEHLHDSLDGIVETIGALDVVTTWHTDVAEACEYFLFAAGGKPPNLLALIAAHPDLTALLEDEARRE